MKLRRRIVIRIAIGLALLLAAALVTIFINNALAQQDPENALPTLSVYYDVEKGSRLPADNIQRDSYTWRFLFWTRSGGGKDLEIWRSIRPGQVRSRSELALEFSVAPREYTVSMMSELRPGTYTALSAPYTVPAAKGDYVYRVEAKWTDDRVVTYYFRINVPW